MFFRDGSAKFIMFDVLKQIRNALAHLFLRRRKFALRNLYLGMQPNFRIFFLAIAKKDHAGFEQKASVMFPKVIYSTEYVCALARRMIHPFALLLNYILQ